MGILVLLIIFGIVCLIGIGIIASKNKKNEAYEENKICKKAGVIVFGIGFSFACLILILNFWHIIDVGNVGVAYRFGTVSEKVYRQGFGMCNVFDSFVDMSVRRQVLNFQSAKKVEEDDGDVQNLPIIAVSQDKLKLDADISFPFMLNPEYAWWVYKNIGEDYVNQLIRPAARTAARDGFASFSSDDILSKNREGVTGKMEILFRSILISDMVNQGLDKKISEKVFTILPVQLRKALPPSKILNAIAEKIAAKEDLLRQKTLTLIEDEVAKRREKEGKGIGNLFGQLPGEYSANDIAQVLNAIANKTRADAIKKAVEEGGINTMVLGGNIPVAVPVP